jgi:hypothetical protein
VVPALLQGTADVWYQQLPEQVQTNHDQLRDAFLRAFAPATTQFASRELLLARVQGDKESVQAYYLALISLFHQVNPAMTDIEKASYFVRGLHSSLRQLVVATSPPNATLDELLQVTRRLELPQPAAVSLPTTHTISAVATLTDDRLDKLEAAIQRLTETVQGVRPARQAPPQNQRVATRTTDGRPICFNCGRVGHTARSCFSQMRNSTSAGNARTDKPPGN